MDLPPQAPRGWHGRPELAPRERSGAPCGEDGVALGPALWRPWTRVLWLTFRVVSGFGNVSVGAGSTRRHPGLSVRVQGAAAWGLWSPRGKGCCSEAGASPGRAPQARCRPTAWGRAQFLPPTRVRGLREKRPGSHVGSLLPVCLWGSSWLGSGVPRDWPCSTHQPQGRRPSEWSAGGFCERLPPPGLMTEEPGLGTGADIAPESGREPRPPGLSPDLWH